MFQTVGMKSKSGTGKAVQSAEAKGDGNERFMAPTNENYSERQEAARAKAREIMAPRVKAAEEKEKLVLASKKEICNEPIYENFSIKVNAYTCPVATLPKGTDYTVVNITDVHFRYYTPSKAPPYQRKSDDKDWIGREGNPKYWYTNVQDRAIIDRFDKTCAFLSALPGILRSKGIEPNLVILGGDYVTKGLRDLPPEAIRALSGLLKGGANGVFILGNKDYEAGLQEEIKGLVSSAGFEYLSNSYKRLTVKGCEIAVVGLDAYGNGVSMPKLPSSLKPAMKLVAIHDLNKLPIEFGAGADGIFSGHWHMGYDVNAPAGIAKSVISPEYRKKTERLQGSEIAVAPVGNLPVIDQSGGIGRYMIHTALPDFVAGPADGSINVITYVGTGKTQARK